MRNILTIILILTPGHMINSQSTTKPFTQIAVDGNVVMILRPDDMHDVDAITNKDDVTYDIRNGKLMISHSNDSKWSDPAKVTVNYTTLTSIKASNGAVVSCEGLMSADSLSLLANKGARFDMIIGCNVLTTFLMNGSEMTLSGKADKFEVQLSDQAVLNAPTLESNAVHIKADAESSATVFALKHIDATAQTSSTIKVIGDPESKEISEMSGGSVQ